MPDGRSRLRGLAGLGRALSRPMPLMQVLELAAETSCRLLPAASCSVSRTEPGDLTVRTLLNVGLLGPDEERYPEAELYPMPEFAYVDRTSEDQVVWLWSVDDPEGTPERERSLLLSLGKHHAISAPILVDGLLWGEMWASRLEGEPRFDVDDAACLEALIAVLSGALSRAEREQELSELAFRDPLTGLLNRRGVDERALRMFDVPTGEVRRVTAVAVDINGLKQANDRYGHQAGDRLIVEVASALAEAFGAFPDAVCARVGGDEFHVLVAGAPTDQVVAAADTVVGESWHRDAATALSCGAAGVTLEHGHADSPAALFAEADRAQYVAKRERRRCTVVAASGEDAETFTAVRSAPPEALER